MADVEVESFRPTGLLGGKGASASSLPSNAAAGPSVDPLVPNGLLGSNVSLLSETQSTPMISVASGSRSPQEIDEPWTNSSLRPNGLLGMSRPVAGIERLQPITDSFTPNGLLSQSQENEFPDAADLLRPYARTGANSDTHNGHGLEPSIYLPRSSVRSYTYGGKAVFLKRRTRTKFAASQPRTSDMRMGSLLDVPLHRLMEDLNVTEARRIAAQPNEDTPAETSSVSSEHTLWVDRYRPNRYTELLGDERVHREVLSWVKEWDHCVFGKTKTKGKKRTRDGEESFGPEDEYRRPPEKMLLLSGPPGLGKTTLAHVVAKQAGYSVFEINASDARTGQVVDERIRPAAEAGYTIGNSKPSLIVIDEIDGATGGGDNATGFVQKLIQLALEKPQKARGKKKDHKGRRPLLRPIICICNDLYASSLARLRPLAKIVRFSRPSDVHLVKRLREICDTEDLSAETRALSTLVGVAQGDLRGCLNTLQFIKGRNQIVTETIVRAATAGMKEADANYFNVLNDLFSPMSKKRAKDLGWGEAEETKYVDRLSRDLDGSGALDRVTLGCFEHYAKTHQHDATFARYIKANEWLVGYDVLSGSMRSEREYALLPYLSYSIVPFYPLFQERGGGRVERPKADWECYLKTKANEEVYKSVARAVRTGNTRVKGDYRDLVSDQILRLEFAPYLNRIISPPLRPVNGQVIRPEEKALLSRLVGIMVSLELRFVQEKLEDGQLVYRLDPPIDVFVTYDGKRASDISVSRYAVRHLVAGEVFEDEGHGEGEGTFARTGPDGRPNKRAKVAPLQDIADRPAVDFFGRPIAVPPPSNGGGRAKPPSSRQQRYQQQQQPPEKERAYRVSFRFREGNSAAVRKPVKMSSFL
ncbi:P-loop containing nucleoside triphosphate hydrolase protein [Amylostereum chailletii]|nr:P-loop containing nucleoside triphosphate hydrolase protein [Amylostereum chailletii]